MVLDPAVVETAGLVHDIGHPPIAHKGEETLNAWHENLPFEGNAQTFRVLSHLGDRTYGEPGLDLTRASLIAAVKYPWSPADPKAERGKFGFYEEDREAFEWAAQGTQAELRVPALEAQIMDWADDITYAVHDAQDYFRDGLIPLHEVLYKTVERGKYLDYLIMQLKADEHWLGWNPNLFERTGADIDWAATRSRLEKRLTFLGNKFVRLDDLGPYDGSFEHRAVLVGGAASLLGTLIEGPTDIGEGIPFSIHHEDGIWRFYPKPDQHIDVFLLKVLLWWKVIPELRHEQAVREEWTASVLDRLWSVYQGEGELPWASRVLDGLDSGIVDELVGRRYIMDIVAGLTDMELEAFYRLLTSPGEDQDEWVRVAETAALPIPPGFERRPTPAE